MSSSQTSCLPRQCRNRHTTERYPQVQVHIGRLHLDLEIIASLVQSTVPVLVMQTGISRELRSTAAVSLPLFLSGTDWLRTDFEQHVDILIKFGHAYFPTQAANCRRTGNIALVKDRDCLIYFESAASPGPVSQVGNDKLTSNPLRYEYLLFTVPGFTNDTWTPIFHRATIPTRGRFVPWGAKYACKTRTR